MENKTLGIVSLSTGLAAVLLQLFNVVLGMIPFLNMLTILVFPLILILDVVAVTTGAVGAHLSSPGTTGRGLSIAGLCIGLLHLALLVFGFVMVLLIVVMLLVVGMLGQM